MSKITNLIGTTWRLPCRTTGLTAEYGEFNVEAKMIGAGEYFGSVIAMEFDVHKFCLGYKAISSELSSQVDTWAVYADAELTVDGSNQENATGYLWLEEHTTFNIFDYEVVFTGGTDISNPLFIDFINTYGTLVSGGEPPTAEGVKTKLQSLITASNAKTGKSDANLTDAVKTLLEGYGQGGGGDNSGDCPINIVDELPEVGVEGEIVGVKTFADVISTQGDEPMSFKTLYEEVYGVTVTFAKSTSSELGKLPNSPLLVYATDIPDVYINVHDDVYQSMSENSDPPATFKGEITDISQATETSGLYAYMKLVLYQYTNGEFKELTTEGNSPLPIEVSTADEMNALLSTAEVGAIYKYTGETTDTYENGALYVVEEEAVNLISFSIEGGFELQAEEGMTWGEYVNSTYNSEETGIVLSIVHNTSYNTDYVVWGDDSQIISTNSERSGAVKTTDVIVANTEYTIYYY